MVNVIKKNLFYILTIIIFSVYFVLLSLKITDKKLVLIFFFIYLFLLISYFLLTKIIIKDKNNYPILFLIVASFFCLMHFLSAPLFTGSDDHFHFYRSYEVANGIYITEIHNNMVGSSLPVSLQNIYLAGGGNETNIKYFNIKDMMKIKLDKENKILYSNAYNNTALYSPIQYLPQALGIKIGLLLNLSLFNIASLGRIFNIIFYLIIGYYSIKLFPKNKLFLFLILTCPNLIQIASTFSSDAMTDSLICLFISLIMHYHDSNNIIDLKALGLLTLISIILAECKIVYFPIILMLFLLKKENFKSNKERKLFLIITFALSLISCLFWMTKTTTILNLAYDKSSIQKDFILSHPLNYLIIFIRTFIYYIIKYIRDLFIGNYMYNAQIIVPAIYSFIYVAIVFLSIFKTSNYHNKKTRFLLYFLSIIIIGLIGTALYVQCTAQFIAVKNPTIYGIQGRYFLPIIFLLPFMIDNKKILDIKSSLLINISIFLNIIVLYYMFIRFI